MDYKRFSLIAALAVVSYLLLLAWNQDYPAQPAQTLPATAANTAIPQSMDIPGAPAASNLDDLPQAQTGVDTPTTRQNTASTALINVRTPVHHVSIDPSGGDIVSLSLPGYPTTLNAPDNPFVLLRNNGGIYVAQSGLVGTNGPDASADGRPLYSSAQQEYVLDDENGELRVELVHVTAEGTSITKRFIFPGNDYLINVEHQIDNAGNAPWRGNLFAQIKRDSAQDPSSAGGFGMNTFLGAALTTPDDPYKKLDFSDMNRGTSDTVEGGWIAFSQHYFITSWIPDQNQTHTFSTRRNQAGEYLMGFVSPETIVAPGQSTVLRAAYYAGPKDQYRLEEIATNMGLTIDYGWLWFIASPIFWLLVQINDVVGNYGWSIILLTIIIKLLFYRLSAASYRSMAKMRRLTPKINQLKDRYGEDKQKLMQAQMELWRKEGVNPMGGCLPMLLQMPVLIALYWVLNESVELRHAPFILWYKDLSVMDPFFVLPLIMGASMYVSQILTPMTTMDPMQAKVMKFMPAIFTVFFLWFPAGLVLYWLVGNVFNIAQQWYINKSVDAAYNAKSS
jgi:YidC/Oxa1 family membrane protein insertase